MAEPVLGGSSGAQPSSRRHQRLRWEREDHAVTRCHRAAAWPTWGHSRRAGVAGPTDRSSRL